MSQTRIDRVIESRDPIAVVRLLVGEKPRFVLRPEVEDLLRHLAFRIRQHSRDMGDGNIMLFNQYCEVFEDLQHAITESCKPIYDPDDPVPGRFGGSMETWDGWTSFIARITMMILWAHDPWPAH